MLVIALAACTEARLPNLVDFDGMDASLWRGPDHCDWDDTWMVHIRSDDLRGPATFRHGEELEEPFPGDHLFVRDPSAVPEYAYAAVADLTRPLPDDARLIASSPEGYELWFADSDIAFVFVRFGDSTEAWVRAVEWNLCH